jgi:hypothetical protein
MARSPFVSQPNYDAQINAGQEDAGADTSLDTRSALGYNIEGTDPQGGFEGRAGVQDLDPALDPEFSSPEAEALMMESVFGTPTDFTSPFGSSLAQGTLTGGLVGGFTGDAALGVGTGASAAAQSALGPMGILGLMGRVSLSTGHGYNATVAGRQALGSARSLGFDEETSRAISRQTATNTMTDVARGGLWSGVKSGATGLYGAISDSLDPQGPYSSYGVPQSTLQAQRSFDRARADELSQYGTSRRSAQQEFDILQTNRAVSRGLGGSIQDAIASDETNSALDDAMQDIEGPLDLGGPGDVGGGPSGDLGDFDSPGVGII